MKIFSFVVSVVVLFFGIMVFGLFISSRTEQMSSLDRAGGLLLGGAFIVFGTLWMLGDRRWPRRQ